MSETTKIDYVDHTWSPWRGCEKVSPGCQNCYAEVLAKRAGLDAYGPGKPRIKTKDWKKPLRYDKNSSAAVSLGASPFRIFPSLCDWLDDAVPIEWLAEFLQLIYDTPNLTWLLLTKRPENTARKFQQISWGNVNETAKSMVAQWRDDKPPSNVWFGVTCENQEMADKRIPILLDIPAKVRWVSCEPLIGPIILADKLDWVVVGGESGPNYRPMKVEWLYEIIGECMLEKIPIWVKQDCGRFPGKQGRIIEDCWILKQLPK